MFLWKMIFLITICFTVLSSSLFMSCLMFVISSMIISMSFLSMNLNWLMYTMIILYLGGMMVLFMYMCSISSMSKIETQNISYFIIIFIMACILYALFPMSESFTMGMSYMSTYSLFLNSGQLVLTMLGIYLIIGLLVSVFFTEKLQGPLKSFYVK